MTLARCVPRLLGGRMDHPEWYSRSLLPGHVDACSVLIAQIQIVIWAVQNKLCCKTASNHDLRENRSRVDDGVLVHWWSCCDQEIGPLVHSSAQSDNSEVRVISGCNADESFEGLRQRFK